eukprot:6559357-Heterocapsa_arctica.AAC.1
MPGQHKTGYERRKRSAAVPVVALTRGVSTNGWAQAWLAAGRGGVDAERDGALMLAPGVGETFRKRKISTEDAAVSARVFLTNYG